MRKTAILYLITMMSVLCLGTSVASANWISAAACYLFQGSAKCGERDPSQVRNAGNGMDLLFDTSGDLYDYKTREKVDETTSGYPVFVFEFEKDKDCNANPVNLLPSNVYSSKLIENSKQFLNHFIRIRDGSSFITLEIRNKAGQLVYLTYLGSLNHVTGRSIFPAKTNGELGLIFDPGEVLQVTVGVRHSQDTQPIQELQTLLQSTNSLERRAGVYKISSGSDNAHVVQFRGIVSGIINRFDFLGSLNVAQDIGVQSPDKGICVYFKNSRNKRLPTFNLNARLVIIKSIVELAKADGAQTILNLQIDKDVTMFEYLYGHNYTKDLFQAATAGSDKLDVKIMCSNVKLAVGKLKYNTLDQALVTNAVLEHFESRIKPKWTAEVKDSCFSGAYLDAMEDNEHEIFFGQAPTS